MSIRFAATLLACAALASAQQEYDLVVYGATAGGVTTAISGARRGLKTVLLEPRNHVGGMATGGLVNIIPNLSEINGKQRIAGFCQEIIDMSADHTVQDHQPGGNLFSGETFRQKPQYIQLPGS